MICKDLIHKYLPIKIWLLSFRFKEGKRLFRRRSWNQIEKGFGIFKDIIDHYGIKQFPKTLIGTKGHFGVLTTEGVHSDRFGGLFTTVSTVRKQ